MVDADYVCFFIFERAFARVIRGRKRDTFGDRGEDEVLTVFFF